jgi:hypothetical protein
MIYDVHKFQKSSVPKHNLLGLSGAMDTAAIVLRMMNLLPSRQLCDQLIAQYLGHWEKTLRILHVPTFLKSCDDFWNSYDGQSVPSPGFLAQLLGILAITSQMDETRGSLCPIFPYQCCEMLQFWINSSSSKHKQQIDFLQAATLLLIARYLLFVPLNKLWLETGNLIRNAMALGLHRDPSEAPEIPIFLGEIRRRVWITILELDVQISTAYGMPTAIREDEFSTKSPSNLHDEELYEDMNCLPESRSEEEWTDTLSQIYLYKSVRLRLLSNQLISRQNLESQQSKVFHLGSSLLDVLSTLPLNLQVNFSNTPSGTPPTRVFGLVLLDLFLRRAFISLFRPLMTLTYNHTLQEFCLACIQSSYHILSYQESLDPKFGDLDIPDNKVCWSLFQGIFKLDIMQAAFCLCSEIKNMTDGSSYGRSNVHTPDDSHSITSSSVTVSSNSHSQLGKTTLTRQVKMTVDALITALPKSDIKDITMLAIVLQSVRTKANKEEKEAIMLDELTKIIKACRLQLDLWKSDSLAVASGDVVNLYSFSIVFS